MWSPAQVVGDLGFKPDLPLPEQVTTHVTYLLFMVHALNHSSLTVSQSSPSALPHVNQAKFTEP